MCKDCYLRLRRHITRALIDVQVCKGERTAVSTRETLNHACPGSPCATRRLKTSLLSIEQASAVVFALIQMFRRFLSNM